MHTLFTKNTLYIAHDGLLAMDKVNGDGIFLTQMVRHRLGTIDTTMLTARAAKGHLHMREITLDKSLHMVIHQRIDMLQKRQYLPILLQKIYHRLIHTSQGLILLILTGVMRGAAVEDIPTTIATLVRGQAALETKTIDCY